MAMLDALSEVTARFIGGFLVEVVSYSVPYAIGWLLPIVAALGRYLSATQFDFLH